MSGLSAPERRGGLHRRLAAWEAGAHRVLHRLHLDRIRIKILVFALAATACGPLAKRPAPIAEPVFIVMGPSGALFIGDQPTSLATLEQDLRRRLGPPTPATPVVVIRAPDDVLYGDFMAVMNALNSSGYRTSLAYIQERP